MPVIFICFIVFVIWVQVKIKQSKASSVWDEEFWEREAQANFVRKKDIEHLDYIQVREEELPFSDKATGKERERQERVRSLLQKKMLNLSGMTNTDIKMEYGTANFPILSEYDQNFSIFIRELGLWGCYLHENMPEEDRRAIKILEYAVSLGSDITNTYVALADIYRSRNEITKIQQLIRQVEDSDFYMKDSIVKQLKKVIQSYI